MFLEKVFVEIELNATEYFFKFYLFFFNSTKLGQDLKVWTVITKC